MIEKQKKRKVLVKKSFLTLIEDEVVLPNKKEAKRLFVMHPGASAILALTPDGHIILTKQYRYAIQKISLEIPAGKKDNDDESFLACAKRELEEETGYGSDEFTWISSYYPCVGYSDEILHLFLAKNCYPIEQPKQQDEDEFIEPVLMDVKQAVDNLQTDLFMDGKTLIALAYLQRNWFYESE